MMKFAITALAALGVASVAYADNFDTNLLTTTVTTKNLEFSASTTVDNEAKGFGDNYALGAGAYLVSYELAGGTSEVFIFGQFGEVNNDEFGVLGAEYIWTTATTGSTTLELTGQTTYVMFDNYDNGDVYVTPSANLSVDVVPGLTAFGEVGYTWNASEDLTRSGGYGEVGLNYTLSDTLTIRPSIVQPFDTANEDAFAAVELGLNF